MCKVSFCLFVLLLFISNSTYGQINSVYFRARMDSFDRVLPVKLPKVEQIGKKYIIRVVNQKQFDCLNEEITKAIMAGEKNVHVKIGKGIYHFHENHIVWSNEHLSDVSVTVESKGAVITSDENYEKEPARPWGELEYADTLISVVDEAQKLCIIPWRNDLNDDEKMKITKVQITQWYKAMVYNVLRIDTLGIYFLASDLAYLERFGQKGYNVNYDYIYGRSIPRFRLYDAMKERNCDAACFFNMQNTIIKQVSIKGLCFNGNKAGCSLISMNNVTSERITIRDCKFENIRSSVVKCTSTGNVVVDKNLIRNTEGEEMLFSKGCINVHLTNNKFENNGLRFNNERCVTCWEATYYIANNTFCDYGRMAIAVGVWHGTEKKNISKGIIEHNEIYYTPTYMATKEKHASMDGGAIYVWTQNDGAIIRYNYIHDYCGMRFNSGIYCDDGACNCIIYGNVIINTPDGYSIHSRRVKDQKKGFRNNANNFIANNIIDGAVVIDGYGTEERHTSKGSNIVLKGNTLNKDRFENLEMYEDDVLVLKWSYEKEQLIVPKEYRRRVKTAGVR